MVIHSVPVNPLRKWFPLRVTYSRERKVRDILESAGLECFVPMKPDRDREDGKPGKMVPAVNNLCFARASRAVLDETLIVKGLKTYTGYIWDRVTREPVVVPDKAMEDFIRVCESRCEDIVYLEDVTSRLKEGQLVRVTAGPFAGVEGRIVRVKRSRRVMVELPGLFAVATGYVKGEDLEIVRPE